MKLTIYGDIQPYYVQTLCMIFFPGEKFSPSEPYTEDTPEVTLRVNHDCGTVAAEVVMQACGQRCEARDTVALSAVAGDAEKAAKRAAGTAIFRAGCHMFAYMPPWGILTGVRPSKVATELLTSGLSREEAIERLCADYLVAPEKAQLACDVARRESTVLGRIPDVAMCSVYISIPFCPTRCAYCSFVSYTSPKLLKLIPAYLVQLKRDIADTFHLIRELGMRVASVYIGGGTPTTLNEAQLEELLTAIEAHTDVSALMEYTLEAGRPDTITPQKLLSAKRHGVTRVSVNTQTLNDTILTAIGRRHTADDFLRSFAAAVESGISHINTDLIAGLPGESCESFAASLNRVVALAPDNVTVHTFCVKKSAEIRQTNENPYAAAHEDAEKSVNYSQKTLVMNGYFPYYMYRQKNTAGNLENVGYAKDSCEGLYNIFMMEEIHSIFAAGAGAVTKLLRKEGTDNVGTGNGRADNVRIERIFSPKYPYEYLRNASSGTESGTLKKIREQALRFFQ